VYQNGEPKAGDLVSVLNRPGLFKIIRIDSASRTATVQLANGSGPRKSGFPWSMLSCLDGFVHASSPNPRQPPKR
jgi:hypothetical protein